MAERRASKARWAARQAWRLAGHGIHAPRARTTALLVVFGIALMAASQALGVAYLSYQPPGAKVPREVGFWPALNWSLTTIVVWPAMFYVLRSLIHGVDRIFPDMDQSSMAWLRGGSIQSTWARHKRMLRRLTVIFLGCGLILSAVEWWGFSGDSLLRGIRPSESEIDWSSLRVGHSQTGWALQSLFALAAFLYQGIALALMLIFAATTILVARTIGLHGTGERSPALLVDIESNDPSNRVGFERFTVVIDYMIVFVALGFANFFLTRVQNAYLHDPNGSTSLVQFINRDLLVRNVDEIGQLFVTGPLDLSSFAVAVGATVALFQCFFFFNATLRHSAMEARNRSDRVLVTRPMLERAGESGLTLVDVRERLRGANVWPLGYSDLMPTLAFLTICLITILFYRIGIYLVFLWIVGWIVARTTAGLMRKS